MSDPSPASVHHLPDDLEARILERVRARAPGSTADECIARLARPAERLTRLFTTERPEEFPDYARDEDARLAYAVLFAPQTWARIRFPLAEAIDLRGFAAPRDRPCRVLDLGAGVATAGLSAAQMLVHRAGAPSVELVSIDRSAAALAAARAWRTPRLASLERVHVDERALDLTTPLHPEIRRDAPYDLVIASFSFNEAFASRPDEEATRWLRELATLLSPTGRIVIVEAALRAVAARLRRVAAPVIDDRVLHVHGPDLHGRLAPPPSDERFADHEVRRWTPPWSLERLNARLRLSLAELTFTSLTLGLVAPAPVDPEAFRLTSPIARVKGRWVFTGLDARGERHDYELLDRGLDDAAAAALRDLERGDVLVAAGARDLGQPVKRRLPGPASLVPLWRPT